MVTIENVSPFWTKRYPLPLLDFNSFSSDNIEQHECCVKFCDFFGVRLNIFVHSLTFIAFMCIIQFELHAHALMHINWLKIQICLLGCMLTSHARNGNECQTPCHLHSAANIEIPAF